ncbi:helix-turn-helix domain-containing protein [Candidatus Glomeribacter gigasporarum]|uniref:helix-turn-helix domain-containing protein n=1 Tax=Candidatus Glomeribacter gigasporarum TaxID=132144 RepID=UPI0005B27C6D|nr:helix-turn-helix transcriptional regulator [Candidatus Glomeribacter gigasporarum]
MNWKKIISDLVAAKLTQKEIAKRIGVTQSAISQILSGKKSAQKGFRYEPGQRLIALYKSYGGDNHLIWPELATASAPPSRPTPTRGCEAA